MAYTSGIRRERSRKRKKFLWRATIALVIVGALWALGMSAYQTGTMLAESRLTEMTASLDNLTVQLSRVRDENARLQASLSEARQANVTLQGRYNSDVPAGEIAELFGITRERLGQGVNAARLAQVLREAGPTKACDTRAVRKRFPLTPAGRPPEDPATLLDGLIQVSAMQPAGTTDAAKAAAITVTRAWASEPLKLTGLPAKQDIVINNAVLRLTVEASEVSGFLTATLWTCGKG